jgi:hypothetical protein
VEDLPVMDVFDSQSQLQKYLEHQFLREPLFILFSFIYQLLEVPSLTQL